MDISELDQIKHGEDVVSGDQQRTIQVTVKAVSSVAPEQVLAAAYGFSEQRARVSPNVVSKRLEVHERGDTFADVTEGGADIARFFWERCQYDWAQPEVVTATVIDSNVLEPGSVWQLRASPRDGGGSDVEMIVARNFRTGPLAATGYALNRIGGKRVFGWMLQKALTAVEKTSAAGASLRADH